MVKYEKFKKKTISFSNTNIFGAQFRSGIKLCFSVVAKMLFDDKITISGGIESDKADNITLTELWSYIYYLYYYNSNDIPEFNNMKDDDGNASGELMYNQVRIIVDEEEFFNVRINKDVEIMHTTSLIYFINKMIIDYHDKIIIPVVEHLQNLLKKKNMNNNLSLKINNDSNMYYSAKLLNDKNINNANIKIQF